MDQNTLTKNGRQKKDSATEKINPKEMSNEELEYIIKTGKLPPKYTQPPPLIEKKQQIVDSYSQQNNSLYKTNQSHPKLQSFLVNPQQQEQMYSLHNPGQYSQNKENIPLMIIGGSSSSGQNENGGGGGGGGGGPYEIKQECDNDKHLSSPRMLNDYLHQINKQSQQVAYEQQKLLTSQNINCFANNISNAQTVNPLSSQQQLTLSQLTSNFTTNQTHSHPDQQYQRNAIDPLLHLQSINQQSSQNQAMQILGDRVLQLEREKLYLQEQMQSFEVQQREANLKLVASLKDEEERQNQINQGIAEENLILKRQLERVEGEKIRHLEENSNEREKWRSINQKVEEENQSLRLQIQEYIEKYSNIEETIDDIKRREAGLRDKYQSEIQNQAEKINSMTCEMNDSKVRYERLKEKLQEQNQALVQQIKTLENEFDSYQNQTQKDIQSLQREKEKYKREVLMLKEEMQILGPSNSQKDLLDKDKQKVMKKKQKHREFVKINKKEEVKRPQSKLGDQTPKPQKKKEEQTLKQRKDSICHSPYDDLETSLGRLHSSLEAAIKNKKSRATQQKKYVADSMSKREQSSNQQSKTKLMNSQTQNSEQKIQSSEMKQQTKSKARTGSSEKRTNKSKKPKKTNCPSKDTISKIPQPKQLSSPNKDITTDDEQFIKRSCYGNSTSSSNLISINTKQGECETFQENLSLENYIYIDGIGSAKRALSTHKLFDSGAPSSQHTIVRPTQDFNQFKRSSIERTSSKDSNMNQGVLNSHQSSLGSSYNPNLDSTYEYQASAKKSVDNEIFFLEREIFDYNQQYKSILSQQSNNIDITQSLALGSESSRKNQLNGGRSIDTATLNQKLRQIAQMLEEKSERLFELKKKQQQMLLVDSLQGRKNSESTIKLMKVQNY